jgi:hypothetical protein
MLSLAWAALFKASLDGLDGPPRPIFDVRQAADWLLRHMSFVYRPDLDFDAFVERERAQLPELVADQQQGHELELWLELTRQPIDPVATATRLMTRLIARYGAAEDCYARVQVSADALSGYPLTLDTLARLAKRWAGMSPRDWMRNLIIEVLSAHQRVAIRKLGQSGEDTLMFRTGEGGLFVDRLLDRIPETQPRLRQAFQILRDLGLTDSSDTMCLPRLTELGVAQLSIHGA